MIQRFGNFEFSRPALRLTRDGRVVRLAGQSLELLVLLLDEPGRLVTREEIRARLWPDATVDFDHSLDVALNRVRAALGDTAKHARFIETVPRVGYRFAARVQTHGAVGGRARATARRVAMFLLTAIVAALAALAIVHQHYGKIVDRASQHAR